MLADRGEATENGGGTESAEPKNPAAEDAEPTESEMYEILGRCYGFVTREVIRPRTCFRLPFSYKLPAPHVVVKQLKYDKQYWKVCQFLNEYDKETQEGQEEFSPSGDENYDQQGCCCPRKPAGADNV